MAISKYLLLGLLCASCGHVGQPVENFTDVFKWEIDRYTINGHEVVVSYGWRDHMIGSTALPTSRCAYWFKEGRCVKMDDLGFTRKEWTHWLRQNAQIGTEALYWLERGALVDGLSTTEVLWICGFPQYGPRINPRLRLGRGELPLTGVWYYHRGALDAQELEFHRGHLVDVRRATVQPLRFSLPQ
jgi:hypothetical protein